MRAYENEPANKVFGEPEIVELGLDEKGNRQWYMATREGFEEVGENGVLQLDMEHFEIGTRITLEEPLPSVTNPHHPAPDGEDSSPCPSCGNEERGQGGYLSCECPAPRSNSEDVRPDVLAAAWTALFGQNIVRTPQRKLLVLACARLVMAERAKMAAGA